MPVEMYKTEVALDVTVRITQTVYVLAGSEHEAKRGVNNKIKLIKINKLRDGITRILYGESPKISKKIIRITPKLIAPIKGKKLSQLTKAQKYIIKLMLGAGEKAKLTYLPDEENWNVPKGETLRIYRKPITTSSVISLRKKGLIKPLIENANELKAQKAMGTLKDGELTFILNLDKLKERKIYHDWNVTHVGGK